MRASLSYPIAALAVLFCSGCDAPPPGAPSSREPVVGEVHPAQPPATKELKERQIAFLNRIREADPQQRTIERALLNEENELGLILDRGVEMDKIPKLMQTMLAQMAQEFPGQDLTVLAYTPSNPPRKIGTARLDARTTEMTYTPER